MGIAHWDDVQKRRNERGQMAGTWSNLGAAAGSSRCGVTRMELGPGEMPTPAHVHGEAEEIFYVLGGSGLTWIDEKAYEIGAGDCIVYHNFDEEHTSELQSRPHLVCRLLLEKKKQTHNP